MTTKHITQEQIETIYNRYGGSVVNCAYSIARQAALTAGRAALEGAEPEKPWELAEMADNGGQP